MQDAGRRGTRDRQPCAGSFVARSEFPQDARRPWRDSMKKWQSAPDTAIRSAQTLPINLVETALGKRHEIRHRKETNRRARHIGGKRVRVDVSHQIFVSRHENVTVAPAERAGVQPDLVVAD